MPRPAASAFLGLSVLSGLLALAPAPAAQIGTVKAEQKINETQGGFGGDLDAGDSFGSALTRLGDLDGDGVPDIAVGARRDDDGGMDQGALRILFLKSDGTVKSQQKISETQGGFTGLLDPDDAFGCALAGMGDLDGDGVPDLAVGALRDDDGGPNRGAVWILFLHTDGTVKSHQKISSTQGWPAPDLADDDAFGFGLSNLGDLDGDGRTDLAVGTIFDDDGGANQGGVRILFLNANATVKARQNISATQGGFTGVLNPDDYFGCSLATIADLDGDGIDELAVGAALDDDFPGGGAVYVMFLRSNGTVRLHKKITSNKGGFHGYLQYNDTFGYSLFPIGDLDRDGVADLAVGAPLTPDGAFDAGALWILFMRTNGTVKSERKISALEGGFTSPIGFEDQFGYSLCAPGDLDGDGAVDLVVGANADSDEAQYQGSLFVLFLVGDTEAPVISPPPAVSVVLPKGTPPAGAVAFFTVTATDDIDPAPSVVCVPPSGSFFPYGGSLVTCTATDATGNQSIRQFPVFVLPTVRPSSGP